MSHHEPGPFDFASHLLHHTSVEHWDIEQLIGGQANHTVRVGRIQGSKFESDGRYSEILNAHSSVIFKQAPAFLAKLPEVPFSPYRQTIEAKALELLHASPHEHPFGLSPILAKNPTIDIPRLLLQDTSVDIIIQSDLGSHPTLDKFLTSPAVSPPLASQLGQLLGQFLANLHYAFDTSSAPLSPFSPTSDIMQTFRNDDADRVIESVVEKATGHMRDAGISDAEVLGRRALGHWNGRKRTAFGHGDIWFGTLLINDPASAKVVEAGGTPTIGICDWEFAGPNHPAADIAQLGAYLHLASLSPLTTLDFQIVLRAFAISLYSAYFSSSPTLDTASHSEFLRSLVIMHGWELINAAGWSSRQHLWCNCLGEGVRCSHVVGMVKEGAQLLRAAEESDDGCGVDHEALTHIPWCKYFPLENGNDCTRMAE